MKTQHGRDLTGAEMAEMFDEFCNSGRADERTQDFVDQVTKRTHRTLQQKMAGLFMRTFEGWSTAQFDARNEATVKIAKTIVEATKSQFYKSLPYI